MAWHTVELYHHCLNITMTVDRSFHTSLQMPGPEMELSVEAGLVVGGTANMNHSYLDNINAGYRGCMDEVIFNEHHLLSNLRPYSGYKSVHEVFLGCSLQFSATEEDPVTFFTSKAFMSLSLRDRLQEGVFELELYPSAKEEDGLVLFSAGNQGQFVAIEMRKGHLVASVGNGEGSKTELHSLLHVNSNSTWYPIQLQLLANSVNFRVGKELVRTSLSKELQSIQQEGPLYVGGLDEEARREAKLAGLNVGSGVGASFRGCLRNVKVNGQKTGLPHAIVTKDVTVGCKVGGALKIQTSISPIDPSQTAVRASSAVNKNTNFLSLKTLEVDEEGHAPLQPKHLKVNLDFHRLGTHPSQILFRIEEQPVHGQLRLDLDDKLRRGRGMAAASEAEEEEQMFSLLDLWQGRVTYVHSGSEEQSDFFIFSVFSNSRKGLPVSANHLRRFDISISPVNDAPVLSLPQGNLFTLPQNSKRRLTTEELSVLDPDSDPEELVFSTSWDFITEAGYLEHQDNPYRVIKSFSLTDLEKDKISFVHHGVSTSRLTLRVSDGEKMSNTVVLRILTVSLYHKLVNNTGLQVNQGEAFIITTNQLAVQVNMTVDIWFNITELPQYGEVQRLHSSGDWKSTTAFAQKQLEKERVRYLVTYQGIQTQTNLTDYFKCKITVGSSVTEEVFISVTIQWIHFKVTRSKMELDGVLAAVVNPEDLHAIAKGVKLDESDLFFRLLTLPKLGQLFLRNRLLQKNSTFSQRNVTEGLVKYELLNRLQHDTRDIVRFLVFSKQANSTAFDFRININAKLSTITIINKGISILEGGHKVITSDNLFTHTTNYREVLYNITASPRHGQLRKINFSNSSSPKENVVMFTNQDITEERIVYVHDDSETKRDSFAFQIVAYKRHKHTNHKSNSPMEEHFFNISVQLVNDQKPVRVVDKVFHVTRDGQRLVTVNDLRYRDDDSDFDDNWLVYTRRGIPMGELVLASDPSRKLYEFTQQDLVQKRVLFIHKGVSFGRFVLFISDGKHYVSALFEVMAQDPYLQTENNTGLLVQRGAVVTLTPSHLSVVSNLDIREPKEVMFEIFHPPKHGFLCLNKTEGQTVLTTADAVSIFTQKDLVEGLLAYQHDGSSDLFDGFNVTARARDVSTNRGQDRGRKEAHLDISVPIKIYQVIHQSAPTVLCNHPVVVTEGETVSISREHLEVVHEDSPPSQIYFTIQSSPALGFIQKISSSKHQSIAGKRQQHYKGSKELSIRSFTQEDLNQGLIIYQQQRTGNTNDSVLLEATNGMTTVGPIRLEIDIIPVLVPLQVTDLTLDEGSSVLLTADCIKVASHHFSHMNFLYQVINSPRYGHLEHSRIPGMPISVFTHKAVEHEYISYIHDGSDTLQDNFTIVANQTEIQKHSLPYTVRIRITPVNDETPAVVLNRGVKVWAGSETEITPDDLSAEDVDTPPEGLEFVITPPSNGFLCLKSNPSRQILNFTQNHIQNRQLLFVHNGALSGGFHFQVNDGVNFASRQIFSTTAFSLVLTLQRNHPIKVYPGSVTAISDQDLQVVVNNVSDIRRTPSVLFTVTVPPKLGRIVQRMADNATRNIFSFTQRMVNDGAILYDQNKPESVGWSAVDSFSFTVSSPPAFLPVHTFSIFISYQANGHHDSQSMTKLLNNAGAVVPEGGKVMIDSSKLDASNLLGKVPEPHRKGHHILYRVVALPRHGVLSAQGRNLTRNDPDFSQVTLNKFGITYTHDDSETTNDSFTFQAWVVPLNLSASSPSSSSSLSSFSSDSSSSPSLPRLSSSSLSFTTFNTVPYGRDDSPVMEMFNITVTPVNDQPPLIRSRAPSMKVVVGEKVILGPNNLQVEDHDNPPEELHYLVISKPNNGYLTLGERPEPVTSFTQYDVNHGRLHFIQQGEASTGVFYFNVTDGHHRPLYKLFSLEVIKPSVFMVNNTGLSLVQGRTAVVLTTNQLAAQTNGQSRANICYTVTTHPRHGRIAINDLEVSTFCHEDLRSGRVVYHMTDLSESEDTFQISVTVASPTIDFGNVTTQTVKVTVRPLIYLREPVRVPSGIPVKLGKAMIDATELARISRTDPVFEVLSLPKHGKLVKMTYDPNGPSEVLKSFTFRDVVQGRVAIEETLSDNNSHLPINESLLTTAQVHAPARPLNDSFVFLLRAGNNVQPAKGELHFTILPHHQMHNGLGGFSKVGGTSRERTTTRVAAQNTTIGKVNPAGQGQSKPQGGAGTGLQQKFLTNKNQNKTHHKVKAHTRWGNHSRSGNRGGRSRSSTERSGGGQNPAPQPQIPFVPVRRPVDTNPVYVAVLPRPASDPLLIILPLLACLLLIVILVVLISVFRRRREKLARLRLIQELAAIQVPTEDSPEHSEATSSVVVMPLTSASCPTSPRIPLSPRRRSLAAGMNFWRPIEEELPGSIRAFSNTENLHMKFVNAPSGYTTSVRSLSPLPTLKDSQYWV
uniref:Chondroitin sulfate proteoglycan 4-like n=2 Tax=Gouania willdenowi TaxID=441366 RepID=A0A8C5HAC2_GOUWI